jgi:hypothetical protein
MSNRTLGELVKTARDSEANPKTPDFTALVEF